MSTVFWQSTVTLDMVQGMTEDEKADLTRELDKAVEDACELYSDLMNMNPALASDIYERLEMNERGEGGSVQGDIAGMTYSEMEEYFQDDDPTKYL